MVEDVGTKGTTSASAVLAAREAGAADIEVINTWQRRERLEELDAIGASYRAIIKEILPTLTPEECREFGPCSQEDWAYFEHAK